MADFETFCRFFVCLYPYKPAVELGGVEGEVAENFLYSLCMISFLEVKWLVVYTILILWMPLQNFSIKMWSDESSIESILDVEFFSFLLIV